MKKYYKKKSILGKIKAPWNRLALTRMRLAEAIHITLCFHPHAIEIT